MQVLSTQKLSKNYGKNRGISNLDLEVNEGEIFGYIGPNGAGKSTTIKLLLDFIRPTSGKAQIFGLDTVQCSKEIKAQVAYIPAEVYYYESMKVGELLNYAASFYKKDCTAYQKKLCEALELDVSRKIEELSTGNKKKVALVQALQNRPKLLIMDEPSSGLDPLVQNTFYSLIEEARNAGSTVFFSSHILSEIQRVCDRVGIIKDGLLVSQENLEDLAKTQYKKVRLLCAENLEIPGAEHFKRQDEHLEFLYKGSANELLRALHGKDLKNIWIEDPDLEDIFMSFYKKGNETK